MNELPLDGQTHDYLWQTDRNHPKAQQISRRNHGCTERPCCQCLTDERNRELALQLLASIRDAASRSPWQQ